MPFDIVKNLSPPRGNRWDVHHIKDNPPNPLPRSRLVLFVHGYNSPFNKTLSDYEKFKKSLLRLAPQLTGDIGFIFWPGYWNVATLHALRYPRALRNALECVEYLADYIHKWIRPDGKATEVMIIAHSMGCRLALESLGHLANKEPLENRKGRERRQIRIFLMAAAVPVDSVKTFGSLNFSISSASTLTVFHSSNDRVLRWLFPMGQLFAEPYRPFFAEAVGLHGNPKKIWDHCLDAEGHGHGDYWSSDLVPQDVGRLLGFMGPYRLPSRSLSERPKPLSRDIAEYDITERWKYI